MCQRDNNLTRYDHTLRSSNKIFTLHDFLLRIPMHSGHLQNNVNTNTTHLSFEFSLESVKHTNHYAVECKYYESKSSFITSNEVRNK